MNRKSTNLMCAILAALGFGISRVAAQAPSLVHFEWKEPPEIKSSELAFDFTQPGQFEFANAIRFAEKGIQISASQEVATLRSREIAVPIPSSDPFLAIGCVWATAASDRGEVMVSVRGSADGQTWGEWNDFEVDEHATHPTGEYVGNLLFLEKATRYFQYRITLRQSTSQLTPTLGKIRFIFISPGATPQAVMDEIQQRSQAARSAQAQAPNLLQYPRPPVVSRTSWGCPQGQSSPYWLPQYTTVTHLVIHHTATSNSSSNWPAVVRSIWQYHTYTNRWGDIGYNYLVDPNGIVYEGRAGGDNVIGAHFSCANSNTMGVAALGTYSTVRPTPIALKSMEDLLAWKCDQTGISPLGTAYHPPTQLTLSNICGHRDANPSPAPGACPSGTVCPGDTLYALLPSMRNTVQSLIDGTTTVTIFFDDFESGTGGWTWNAPWGLTTASSYSPTHSFTDSPSGNYGNNSQVALWSPAISLSGVSNATLTFWHQHDFQTNKDLGEVSITTDDGASYTLVASFTGKQTTWAPSSISLNAFVGNSAVKIRFQLRTNASVTRDGWYIDDVEVFQVGGTLRPAPIAALAQPLSVPTFFGLSQNFPNPFNPATMIEYEIPVTKSSLPAENRADRLESQDVHVRLYVTNMLGQIVRVLVDQEQKPGFHLVQWDGKNDDGQSVSSGIYSYTVVAGDFMATKRMTLLK